ncbi:SUN domain-containing protein 5-like isoform X9 [Colius striatus]|uniref:SUN domain-containing protein 5-like isoform X9 n=1 Tax=Colius striatus TaxID=57412 RepID=UPI002B1CFAED|nr:SUN domain-containing protein 5-like isoform X9 [Colius striatus]
MGGTGLCFSGDGPCTGLCFSGDGLCLHVGVYCGTLLSAWRMQAKAGTEEDDQGALNMALEDNMMNSEWALKNLGATIDMKRTFKTYWCKWNWFYNMLKRGCAEDGPDTILQMDVSLGKRWCFPGHYGRVVIRLPAPVHPTAIAVQHVTKEGSLSVAASSAPRDVAVYCPGQVLQGLKRFHPSQDLLWPKPLRVLDKSSRQRLSSSSASTRLWLLPRRGQGLGADGDEEAWHTYDVEKEDIQAFHLKNTLHPRAFSYIKVLILNNWGNSEYICTSRVWVHGKMAKPESPL